MSVVKPKTILASLVISLAVLSGCGGDSDPLDLSSQSIAGTWRLRSATVGGQTITCSGTGNNGGNGPSCGEGTVRFGLDKSFVMDGRFYGGFLALQRGTWDIQNGALVLSIREAGTDTDGDGTVEESEIQTLPQPLTVGVGLSGDRLTLRGLGSNGSTDLTFER